MNWMPVSERVPDKTMRCLAYGRYVSDGSGPIVVAVHYLADARRWIEEGSGWEVSKVTHWMPLPEPPNE